MRYPAIVTREGAVNLIVFPDCPGCQTFARSEAEIEARALDALEGWLEVGLEDGEALPAPSKRPDVPRGGELRWIQVPVALSAAIEVRNARVHAHLTQAALGSRIGVSQQAIARIERAGGNISVETLEKVARGLGRAVEIHLVTI
jgi:predicted RNase H-like HicB family nuclease/DNA-binding XRE family transcriptional regulator